MMRLSKNACLILCAEIRVSFIAFIDSRNCVGVNCNVVERPRTLEQQLTTMAHPVLQLQRIDGCELYNLTTGVIPLYSKDFPRVVHNYLANWWTAIRRIWRRRSIVVRRLGYQTVSMSDKSKSVTNQSITVTRRIRVCGWREEKVNANASSPWSPREVYTRSAFVTKGGSATNHIA